MPVVLSAEYQEIWLKDAAKDPKQIIYSPAPELIAMKVRDTAWKLCQFAIFFKLASNKSNA